MTHRPIIGYCARNHILNKQNKTSEIKNINGRVYTGLSYYNYNVDNNTSHLVSTQYQVLCNHDDQQ